MPFYDYECEKCGEITEISTKGQEFPPSIIACPVCGVSNARRIFSAVTVIQKGYKQGDARYGRGSK